MRLGCVMRWRGSGSRARYGDATNNEAAPWRRGEEERRGTAKNAREAARDLMLAIEEAKRGESPRRCK